MLFCCDLLLLSLRLSLIVLMLLLSCSHRSCYLCCACCFRPGHCKLGLLNCCRCCCHAIFVVTPAAAVGAVVVSIAVVSVAVACVDIVVIVIIFLFDDTDSVTRVSLAL